MIKKKVKKPGSKAGDDAVNGLPVNKPSKTGLPNDQGVLNGSDSEPPTTRSPKTSVTKKTEAPEVNKPNLDKKPLMKPGDKKGLLKPDLYEEEGPKRGLKRGGIKGKIREEDEVLGGGGIQTAPTCLYYTCAAYSRDRYWLAPINMLYIQLSCI